MRGRRDRWWSLQERSPGGHRWTSSPKARFAMDPPVEQAGFEPSVPIGLGVLETPNKTVLTSGFIFTGDRGFESGSLHQRVSLRSEFRSCRRSGPKAPAFPAGVPGCACGAVGREPQARQYRANLRQYLCGAIFQYRIFGDAVATSWWAKVRRPGEIGIVLDLGILVDLESSDRAQAKPSAVR
jgi:hypothetical protein